MGAEWQRHRASGNVHRTLTQGDMKDKGNSEWSLPKMTKSCDKTVGAKVTEPYSVLPGTGEHSWGRRIEVFGRKKNLFFCFKLRSLCPSLRRV